MSNPIITAIKSGTAPKPARLAAARGMLPLSQEEILEALIALRRDPEEDVRATVEGTIGGLDTKPLLPIAQNPNASIDILSFFATWPRSTHEILEAVILNKSTPDEAIAQTAAICNSANLLEAITINQQRLIRHPAILDAILRNPYRSPDAERRAREIKIEFFEKKLGAQQVAEEQKARERLARIIGAEVTEEEFQQVLSQFEAEMGEKIEDGDAIMLDPEAELKRFLYEAQLEGEEVTDERKSVFQEIAGMTVKQRIFCACKAGREARMILVRDSNKMVCSGVIKNPRISESEIEMITKLKSISEEVFRLICMNRQYVSNYSIMRNLCFNPRTPMTFSMSFVNRLQLKDLKGLQKDKGVSEVMRNMAKRLVSQRQPN
jgi:hypothetical protein